MFSPAFHRRVATLTPPFLGKEVRLVDGANGVPAFEAAARRLFTDVKVNGRPLNLVFQEPALTTARVRRSVRPYVVALWIFAVLGAIAALAVVGQAVTRSTRPLREDRANLIAIGFTRGQLVASAALQGAVTATIGATVAFVIAVVGSQFMPIGPLRSIDPEPGIRLDGFVLIAGMVVLVGVTVVLAALSLRTRRAADASASDDRRPGRATRRSGDHSQRCPLRVRPRTRRQRPRAFNAGRHHDHARRVGDDTGVRRGPEPVRRLAGPVRLAMDLPSRRSRRTSGHASPRNSLHFPALPGSPQGSTRSSRSGTKASPRSASTTEHQPRSCPSSRAVPPSPTTRSCSAQKPWPRSHTQIGATIPIGDKSAAKPFRVVGKAVFPRFAPYQGSEPTGLGIGLATTAHAIRALHADNGAPFFTVRTVPGQLTTPDALIKALRSSGTDPDNMPEVWGPQRPNDVMSYDHLSRTPLALAGFLAFLALGSAIHLLVTSVRGRRRDVALLKTIGITRRQARAAVLVQATVLVSLALAIALPLGVLSGRWLWTQTAHWLGIAGDPAIPFNALIVVIAAAMILANAVAFGPAAVASRTRPAIALRSE